MLQYGVVIWGTTVGIGAADSEVLTNPLLLKQLVQVSVCFHPSHCFVCGFINFYFFQVQYYLNLTYLLSMFFVKVSVCGTLLRICSGSQRRILKWTLWILMLVIVVSVLGGLITFVTRCGNTTGCLDSNQTMAALNWVGVAFYMACDLALAIIPVFIVKDLRMKRSLKASTIFVLALGGV